MSKQIAKDEYPLTYVKGVGPKRARALADVGIRNWQDLLWYFPKSYIDRNVSNSIKSLKFELINSEKNFISESIENIRISNESTIIAKVKSINLINYGRNKRLLKIIITDNGFDTAQILFWNSVDYFKNLYKIGQTIVISGRPELDKFNILTFNHPVIDAIEAEDEEKYIQGQILPRYQLNERMINYGITQKLVRNLVNEALNRHLEITENLPDEIIFKYRFPNRSDAVVNLHFPSSKELLLKSQRRIKFEEFFYYQLLLAIKYYKNKTEDKGIVFEKKSVLSRKLFESLPFELTSDQKRVIREIANDFKSGKPMNRLLQGDVGSGKTIVALFAMLMAIDNGYQTAIMAPTEILAEQHFKTINGFVQNFGVNCTLLTGSIKDSRKSLIIDDISSGRVNIVIGTHALFEERVKYYNLGLIIIDEQHKFGVAQRAQLKKLANQSLVDNSYTPHLLLMSATPIPRTLTMSYYGDLDLSVLKEMPKNRKPIKTKIVFESNLQEVYEFVKNQLKIGRQAYIVYPLVEKSEKLDLKSAVEYYEHLSKDVFSDFKCGLLHGQMKWDEKENVMREFLEHKYDVLVATTVVEVGIDVANATVMVVENAERFGLSQLHQLRGRIGRGSEQSYCILVTKDHYRYHFKKEIDIEKERNLAMLRLKSMEETNDGFKIAEIDLKIRGPGDILGTKQSGLPEFKYADIVADVDILRSAREEAFRLVGSDPTLQSDENIIIKNELRRKQQSDELYLEIA